MLRFQYLTSAQKADLLSRVLRLLAQARSSFSIANGHVAEDLVHQRPDAPHAHRLRSTAQHTPAKDMAAARMAMFGGAKGAGRG